jgi:hypothetical protein
MRKVDPTTTTHIMVARRERIDRVTRTWISHQALEEMDGHVRLLAGEQNSPVNVRLAATHNSVL